MAMTCIILPFFGKLILLDKLLADKCSVFLYLEHTFISYKPVIITCLLERLLMDITTTISDGETNVN